MKKAFLGILILLFSVSLVMADHVSISASAFSGHYQGEGYSRDSYGRYIGKTISPGYLQAQVSLPDGCKIKKIRLNCVDNTDNGFITATLVRMNHFTGDYSNLFSVTTLGATSSSNMQWFVDSTCSPPAHRQVQNGPVTWNLYLFFTEAGTDLWVYSVQIEYTW